ncbi:MAG TPA: hypothetical protein VH418_03155 [Solirubrobacteraceae bacterium]|jgi:hypothetical protein
MTASVQPVPEPATLSLERFAWDSPDRLEVSGWFQDLEVAPPEAPVLTVQCGEKALRLPAVADRLSGPPKNGRRWWAAFAWDDAPAAFDRALLEVGDLIVALPPPRPSRDRRGERLLAVQRGRRQLSEGAGPAGERLALQADLMLAQEEVRSLRGVVEQGRRDLGRARTDLDAERERRAGDAERFRKGLAQVQASAEDALAAERGSARRLGEQLEDARHRLREQSERIAALERVAADAGRRRTAIEAACADTERLLARMTGLRDALTAEEPA